MDGPHNYSSAFRQYNWEQMNVHGEWINCIYIKCCSVLQDFIFFSFYLYSGEYN